MNTIYTILIIFLSIYCAVSLGFGMNPKKLHGRIQILACYVLGFVMGPEASSLGSRLGSSMFVGTTVAVLGIFMWHKRANYYKQ